MFRNIIVYCIKIKIMTVKKVINEIVKLWKEYCITPPYGVENLLFRDLNECRSRDTRTAYLMMLEHFLKEMDEYLAKNERAKYVYHYAIHINEGYCLYLSLGVMSSKLSFSVHSCLCREVKGDDSSKEKWGNLIAKIKGEGYDISNSGKYNCYLSFSNNEDFRNTWDWKLQSLIEDYKEIIKIVKNA